MGTKRQITTVWTTYTWDVENRLTGIAYPDASRETYTYSADGLRQSRETAAGVTSFIWDGQNLLQETDAAGAMLCHYTDWPGTWGGLTSLRRGTHSRWYGFDQSANARFLTNPEGYVTDRYGYGSFGPAGTHWGGQSGTTTPTHYGGQTATPVTETHYGGQTGDAGSVDNPLRFGGEVGYYQDTPERLQVRDRELDPSLGRWLSGDPIGFEGGDVNLYRHVGNDPINWIDPDGLDTKPSLPKGPYPRSNGMWIRQYTGNITEHGGAGGAHVHLYGGARTPIKIGRDGLPLRGQSRQLTDQEARFIERYRPDIRKIVSQIGRIWNYENAGRKTVAEAMARRQTGKISGRLEEQIAKFHADKRNSPITQEELNAAKIRIKQKLAARADRAAEIGERRVIEAGERRLAEATGESTMEVLQVGGGAARRGGFIALDIVLDSGAVFLRLVGKASIVLDVLLDAKVMGDSELHLAIPEYGPHRWPDNAPVPPGYQHLTEADRSVLIKLQAQLKCTDRNCHR